MDRADVKFTVDLDTSSAERKLDKLDNRMKASSHIYNDVFKDVGQGFKMVGQPYTPSNNYDVPSTKVLETSLSNVTNAMDKFARIVEAISVRMVNFTMVGNPYTNPPQTVYASSNVSGYIPSQTTKTARPYTPKEHYTRAQVNAINNPDLIFEYNAKTNTAQQYDPYVGVYGTFSRMNNASGMYDTYRTAFGENLNSANQLALPAPNVENTGNADSPKEKGKDITEQNKKDNDELKDKLVLWGKIGASILAIRKVLQGLAKAWKLSADNISDINRNINEEGGYFSVDAEGAMRSNVDRTRSAVYAGIRNMGRNSPVSKSGFDYASQKMSDIWQAAVSGRSVDERTTIDIQRLKDFFGVDLSPEQLLTGQREGKTATDIQLEMMNRIEEQLSKLDRADSITKGQVSDSLRNVLGDELVNAIVSNYNKNLKIDNKNARYSLSELLLNYGGSALPIGNLTEVTSEAVQSIGDLKNSFQELKNTLALTVGPALTNFTVGLTNIVDWINKKVTPNSVESGTPASIGSVKVRGKEAKATDEGKIFGSKQERKAIAMELLKTPRYADDVINALYYLNPNLETEGSIETDKKMQMAQDAIEALYSGSLDPESSNPFIAYLANYEYKGKKGIEALRKANKAGKFGRVTNILFRDAITGKYQNRWQKPERENYKSDYQYNNALRVWENTMTTEMTNLLSSGFFQDFATPLFGEGGAYDINNKEGDVYDFMRYSLEPSRFKTGDEYYEAVANFLKVLKDTNYGREYIQSYNLPSKEELAGEDKVLDIGEVVFTIKMTDERGTVLQSKEVVGQITNSVK